MSEFDHGALAKKLKGMKADFRAMAASLSLSPQELNGFVQGEATPTQVQVEAIAVQLGCGVEDLLVRPAEISPNHTIDDLKEALELLHNRGRLTWLRLAEWRVVSNFLAANQQVFELSTTFWQTATDGIFDVALLELLDLIHRKSLGIQFVLDTALANKSALEWKVDAGRVEAWVAEDQTTLNHWRLVTQSARTYRNRRLAHYDVRHLSSRLEEVDYGVIPSDVRDALYDCSRILNRYSQALTETLHAWSTDDLHNFELVGRALVLGQEQVKLLLSDSPDIDQWEKNFAAIERADRRVRHKPPHISADDWRWEWLERYQRDFRAGTWPRA